MKRRRKPARLARRLPQAPDLETPPGRRLVLEGIECSTATLPDGKRCAVLRLQGLDGNGERVHFDVGVQGDSIDQFQVAMHQVVTGFKEEEAQRG